MAVRRLDRYGWIGLGNMGLAMATNVQKHLSSIPDQTPLAYTNRTLSRGDSLMELGARGHATPAEVVEQCDIVFLSLSDDAALVSIITTLLHARPSLSSKLLVDTSTVSPSTTRYIASLIASADGSFLSSPVFGATPVAVAGKLLVALGGEPDSISRIKPLLDSCVARAVIVAGPRPEDATLLKAFGNFITAGMAEMLGEAFVLAEKSNLPLPVLSALVDENYGSYAGSIAEKLMQGIYAPPKGERPRSDVKLAVKDVKVGVDIAEKEGVDLAVGKLCLERLKDAKEWGEREGRGLDSSSVYGVARLRAGLEFERQDILENRAQEKRAGTE